LDSCLDHQTGKPATSLVKINIQNARGALTTLHAATSRRPTRRPIFEVLEDRLCPIGGYLLVSSFATDSVLRYDEALAAPTPFRPPRRRCPPAAEAWLRPQPGWSHETLGNSGFSERNGQKAALP